MNYFYENKPDNTANEIIFFMVKFINNDGVIS